MRFVLANSALDVAGVSNVEHVPLAAQDVNIVGFLHARDYPLARSRLSRLHITT
jgi:hypothetical protein